MLIKFLGKKSVGFTNDKGETISGITLYGCFQDPSVEGYRAEHFFIRDGIEFPDCKLNDMLDISFNMKGKVEKITKA